MGANCSRNKECKVTLKLAEKGGFSGVLFLDDINLTSYRDFKIEGIPMLDVSNIINATDDETKYNNYNNAIEKMFAQNPFDCKKKFLEWYKPIRRKYKKLNGKQKLYVFQQNADLCLKVCRDGSLDLIMQEAVNFKILEQMGLIEYTTYLKPEGIDTCLFKISGKNPFNVVTDISSATMNELYVFTFNACYFDLQKKQKLLDTLLQSQELAAVDENTRISIYNQSKEMIMRSISPILGPLHKNGFSHDDIAPRNIVYCPYNNSVRLIDWQERLFPNMEHMKHIKLSEKIRRRIKQDDNDVANLLEYLYKDVLQIKSNINDKLIKQLDDNAIYDYGVA
jgi:hypothetical protein